MLPTNPTAPTSHCAHCDYTQPRHCDRRNNHPDRISKRDRKHVSELIVQLAVRDDAKREIGRQHDAPHNGGDDAGNQGEDRHVLRAQEHGCEERDERQAGGDGVQDQEEGEAFLDGVDDVDRISGSRDEFRGDSVSNLHRRAFPIVGEDRRKVEYARRAGAPDTEAQVRRDRRRRLARGGLEIDLEEVYGFDDGERERGEQVEHECCEERDETEPCSTTVAVGRVGSSAVGEAGETRPPTAMVAVILVVSAAAAVVSVVVTTTAFFNNDSLRGHYWTLDRKSRREGIPGR